MPSYCQFFFRRFWFPICVSRDLLLDGGVLFGPRTRLCCGEQLQLLHLVLQMEAEFLQPNFFDLFIVREDRLV